MASKKPSKTLADYVTIALSPVLIMALVGSLVFFLLEVLYVGQYSGRLQWTLFFFVFAIVLISRISIEIGGGRAFVYGLALAAVVFLALQVYVEYPPDSPMAAFGWAINLGLMALSWWCAHRLTWDCTSIEDSVDATGKGVLEAAGLDQTGAVNEDGGSEIEDRGWRIEDRGWRMEDRESRSGEDDVVDPRSSILHPPSSPLIAWWDRYRRYTQEQRRKPHTPGVWVVYFSLAALPLFGLGQALIPTADEARRRYAFWLMVCYVGSGLALLVTTSFLGLRRYLRQRKLQMPAAMTGVWMALGGGIIALLLVAGALLPRPYGEYQLVKLTPLGSPEREASPYAIKNDGAGKGNSRPSSDPARDDQKAETGSGNKPAKDGQGTTSAKSSNDESGKDGSGSGNKQGNQKEGNAKGDSTGQNNSEGDRRSSDAKDRDGEKRGGEEKSDPNNKQTGSKPSDRPEKPKDDRGGGSPVSQQFMQHKPEHKPPSGGSQQGASNPASGLLAKLGSLANVLKWIVFAILALVVAFFLLRSGLRFLANFTNWARQLLNALQAWWQGLFGGTPDSAEKIATEDVFPETAVAPAPFTSFHNPFRDGRADQLSPDELARYSFEALESWAWEQGIGRRPQETPIEFAERLAGEVPELETETRRLAGLYARAAYAHAPLTAGCLGLLRQFWQCIEGVNERTAAT
jgi:hypothetical protein